MKSNEIFLRLIERAREVENMDYYMGQTGLNKTEFRLLREVVFAEQKGETIISSEIARRIGVTRSAVSQIVTKLEKESIVKRTPSMEDKKTAYLGLTDSAKECFEKLLVGVNDFMQRVIAVYGEERMKSFISEYDELYRVIVQVKKENKERGISEK